MVFHLAWFAEKIENIGGLHRCELLADLAISTLMELLQKVGIALNPTHQVSTCYHWFNFHTCGLKVIYL